MLVILADPSKFVKLGQASCYDNTANIELKLQKRLLDPVKEIAILKRFCRSTFIHPIGSQRLRMYNVPKMHKCIKKRSVTTDNIYDKLIPL